MADFTSCPQCQTRYRTAGMPVGKRLRCRKCRAVFSVQEDAASTPTIQKPADEKVDADALPAGMGQQSSLSVAGVHGGVVLGQDKPVVESLTAATGDEKYAVEDEIARGGMGAILKAVDRDIRRPVAMKVMLGEADERKRARFVEEAQVTGQLEHPNIVPIHELGVDSDGRLFFTMKLVKGRSLEQVLKAQQKGGESGMSLGALLNAFVNVCNAVAFAHSKIVKSIADEIVLEVKAKDRSWTVTVRPKAGKAEVITR
ncbi:MAG: protein kinase [Planctomycetota bacterium]|nr:protein kinase [Planctomycetota bacterium]